MRKTFELQYELGARPIEEIKINTKSRHELPPVLLSLQNIYCNKEVNEKIFKVMWDKLCAGKKKTGRPGLNLWQILVLGIVRLSQDLDYDMLHDQVNNHKTVREMMGIESDYGFKRKELHYQNIVDNVRLLDEELLGQINEIIASYGHKVFKKKDDEQLSVKADTYALESNVHFPADYNLLWDSGRKCCDVIKYMLEDKLLKGNWRKLKDWRKKLKNAMRSVGEISRKGGKNKESRLKQAVIDYLVIARNFEVKVTEVLNIELTSEAVLISLIRLEYFKEMLSKHIDLLERRIIKGETIEHSEKIFSIFETYTEWISKGKQNPNVELGKKILVSTDQWGLIIDYKIVEKEADSELYLPLVDRLTNRFGDKAIGSLSTDKSFYSKANKELSSLYIDQVIQPKKGKKNSQETEEEKDPKFKKLKFRHSAIESNINELEHNGLNRCPDKGRKSFGRYVGLGILSYNLHRIGNELAAQQKQQAEKLHKKAA
jgi:IS5 family transposase